MNNLNVSPETEKQEWVTPEVQSLSIAENTLSAGGAGDDGFDGGS